MSHQSVAGTGPIDLALSRREARREAARFLQVVARRGRAVTLRTHTHLPTFNTTGIFGSPRLLKVRRVASRVFSRVARATPRARRRRCRGGISFPSRPARQRGAIRLIARLAGTAARRVAASRVASSRGRPDRDGERVRMGFVAFATVRVGRADPPRGSPAPRGCERTAARRSCAREPRC